MRPVSEMKFLVFVLFFVSYSLQDLPKEAANTADFLLFMDKLFDSLNGSTRKPQKGKTLRCAVTSSSPHVPFWKEAIRVLVCWNLSANQV